MTYIEPPPGEDSSPEHVLKYLARYLTGGPISDRRLVSHDLVSHDLVSHDLVSHDLVSHDLVSHDNGKVTFTARAGRTVGGDADDIEKLAVPGVEFVRRWCLHILPSGSMKTRRYGG